MLHALVMLVFSSLAITHAKDFKAHERIPIFVNNVGPFHNPAESYRYYSLPFCFPKNIDHPDHFEAESNLGNTLAGDRREPALYDIRFNVDINWQSVCGKFKLTQDEIKAFIEAIERHYIFEMFVDDLPIKGFVGELEETQTRFDSHVHNQTHRYLFTHLDFSIAYNGNQIISCNLTTDPQQRIMLEYGKDIEVEFSYSAHWIPTHTQWIDRMTVHSRSSIGEQAIEIHWLSIINSFVLVILLTAFLAVILMRVLKKDFARYMELEEDELDDEAQDEVGWKLVHGDVFRVPRHIMLFSSAIGTGAQMFVLIVSILTLAIVGTFYPGNRGALYTAALILYAFTAVIAGYVSTSLYLSLGGTKWATNAVLTAGMFAGPFFLTFSFVNSIAWYYGSSTALPWGTIVLIILSWGLVTFPLNIFGAMRGRNSAKPFDAPCKTNRVEREIPPPFWYRSTFLQLLIAGFLPFSAIYIELHYIFASVWGHRVYTLFGILTLAFIMLILVTAFITIALTYFQLAAEDYHWWWRSFLSGCSTGVFMYVYAIFYYMYRSEMTGFLQGVFFFGYMAIVSYAFSLMLGAVSYYTAQAFVKHIYRSIKID